MVIGLCKGSAELPKDLLKLGYIIHYIEYPFTNSSGEQVKPEIIIKSFHSKNTLLFEFKTGESIDLNQLQRYSRVTLEDIKQRAWVETQCLGTFDIVYLCLSDKLTEIVKGFKSSSFQPPLLSYDRSIMKLALNNFKEERLNVLFKKGIAVKFDLIPTDFVPFHQESRDWEFAEALIPIVIQCMLNNESRIVLESVCKELIPQWNNLSHFEQSLYENKILDLINLASIHDFKDYLLRPSKEQHAKTRGKREWEIINNPLITQPYKHSKVFLKLQNIQRNFIEFLKTGNKTIPQEELPF